jgi:hypothetical protein
MSQLPKIEPLSKAVSTLLERAYRAGGLGLSLLTLGAILMLVAYVYGKRGLVSHAVLVLGAILILSVLVYFYIGDMRKLVGARKKIRENKELVDTVQQTAVEATQLALHLQALAFKYADQVALMIQALRPLIKDLLLVGKYADIPALVRAEDLSVSIVKTTQTLNDIVGDIQNALVSSDASGLKQYLNRLENYKIKVQDLLKQVPATVEL